MDSQLLNVFTLGVRIGARGIFWVGTKMTYFYYLYIHSLGFPGGASDRRPACQCKRYETQVPALSQKDPLEKVMATHSSILPRRIPRTEEPGELQFTASQRVGHN